jgi:hypothetical protein
MGRALAKPITLPRVLGPLGESAPQTLAGSIALQEDFNGADAAVSYLDDKEKKP